ncbi:nucleobindin-2-like isoform X2 [Planococcus citri]|uniref:nucleobindin-2-like isoform X2 n=1 Tax=Planococcus citri TaxID=170843 RepID=UPI0031F81631
MLNLGKYSVILLYLISSSLCLPPRKRLSDEEFDKLAKQEEEQRKQQHPTKEESPPYLEELGIEYTRYLQQVIETLEKDEQFKKKLESADEHDIKSAKIADELEFVNHHVRSKLDELKRTELDRLRALVRESAHANLTPPGHIDHENPNTFEVKDFKKLIKKVAEDLEDADKKRKQMFKEYEMQKHFEREETIKNMTEDERKQFLAKEEEERKREAEAKKKIHHPGSKQQLEEVWVEQDHMNKNDFNPKTFFVMHDVDGNGFLDEEEVKALFMKELDKLYVQGMPHADLMERAEEMERMREHVFLEMDRNRDRLISWQEFHAMSLRPEFNEDTGWDPIDEQKVYSPEEMAAFEKARKDYMDEMIRQGKIQPHPYPVNDNHLGTGEPLAQGNGYAAPQYAQQGAQGHQYVQQPQGQQFVQPPGAPLGQQFVQQPQQNQQFVQQPHQGQQFVQQPQGQQFVQQPQQNQQFAQQPQQTQQQFAQQPQQNQQFAQQPQQNQQFAQQPQQNQQFAQQPQQNQQFPQPQQPQQNQQFPQQNQQFAQQPQQNQQYPQQPQQGQQFAQQPQAPVDNAIPQSGVKNDVPKQPFEQVPNNLPK